MTELAPVFGARLSGLLATYPLFGAVLAAFAHRLSGAAAAGRVLRGLLIGLFGFTGFFLLLALTIEPLGIAVAFAAATALAVSAITDRPRHEGRITRVMGQLYVADM